MTQPANPTGEVARRSARFAFTLLFLMYMFDYIDRMMVSSLFESIKGDWQLSDAQCAMFVSAVYLSISLFTMPISYFIDRWSRKKCIALMGFVWSTVTGLCAFTRSFGQLFTAKMFIGVGEAGYAPGGTAMISAMYPEKKRALMMGLWSAAIPLGGAIGIAGGGIIAETLGWRYAFGLVALPGMIIALLFLKVKDYKTVALTKTATADGVARQEKMRARDIARDFLRTKSLIFTYFAFAGNTFVTTALLVWLKTYFQRFHVLSESQAGLKGGSVMLLAIIGAPLGGYLADRWFRKRITARPLFAGLASLVSTILLFIAFRVFGELPQDQVPQYVTLLLTGAVVASFIPAAVSVTQDVVHPGLRAISYSVCVIVQNVLGSAMGPFYIGLVSDRSDLHTALSTLPFFTLFASVMFFLASIFYQGDLEKVEKVELEFEP